MVKYTPIILQQMLKDFESVFDHIVDIRYYRVNTL